MEHYFFNIKGAKQGQFKGELRNLKGREDWIAGVRFFMRGCSPHKIVTSMVPIMSCLASMRRWRISGRYAIDLTPVSPVSGNQSSMSPVLVAPASAITMA